MRLNPHYPVWYLIVLGWAYELMRNYDEARDLLKRALIRDPDFLSTHIILAIHYIETGQKQKAQAEVAEILRINPEFSMEMLRSRIPYKDRALMDERLEILRQAGLM